MAPGRERAAWGKEPRWRDELAAGTDLELGIRHLRPSLGGLLAGRVLVEGDDVDQRVEVEGGKIRVVRLDVDAVWIVIPRQLYLARPVVVQERKRDSVLRPCASRISMDSSEPLATSPVQVAQNGLCMRGRLSVSGVQWQLRGRGS